MNFKKFSQSALQKTRLNEPEDDNLASPSNWTQIKRDEASMFKRWQVHNRMDGDIRFDTVIHTHANSVVALEPLEEPQHGAYPIASRKVLGGKEDVNDNVESERDHSGETFRRTCNGTNVTVRIMSEMGMWNMAKERSPIANKRAGADARSTLVI